MWFVRRFCTLWNENRRGRVLPVKILEGHDYIKFPRAVKRRITAVVNNKLNHECNVKNLTENWHRHIAMLLWSRPGRDSRVSYYHSTLYSELKYDVIFRLRVSAWYKVAFLLFKVTVRIRCVQQANRALAVNLKKKINLISFI